MIIIEEDDPRFFIADSTLPNAGKGLFAKQLVPKGSTLEVIGAMVRTNSVADRCTHYADRYKFAGSKGNAKIVPFGYAGIVNHTEDKNLQNVELQHIPGYSKRSPHASEIVYFFLRDVLPGEEVLGNYGQKFGEEVRKIANGISFYEANKEEWKKFLSFNLYRLDELCQIIEL